MDFSLMKEFMDRLTAWRIPGNSISVYHKGSEVFRYSSGYSDVESKTPMNGDELLNIYSCSKITTVTAALQLYERGLFLLDDPLYDFIPEYREMYVKTPDGTVKKAENAITMRHLFTMTAGLTYNFKTDGLNSARKLTDGKMDTLTVARCIAQDPLSFEPGDHWAYSLCHDVLAAAVEVISGKRFRDYVKENIFTPLGVSDVYYQRPEEVKSKMASQYDYFTGTITDDIVAAQINSGSEGVWKNIGKDVAGGHRMGEEYDSGGAGIAVSVADYAKLGNALAMGGKADTGERILASSTVDLMRQNQLSGGQIKTFNWSQLKGYGYGLGVRCMIDKAKGGSTGSLGEFGWGGAAGATMLVDPDREFALFYAHHMLNPQEEYYQPRLRNVVYTCLDR
ncbi:MAG: beta-lactamase family protein [Clostridia bacterium]|nr:beta-lactamase family protein [Clostridia bacterium]